MSSVLLLVVYRKMPKKGRIQAPYKANRIRAGKVAVSIQSQIPRPRPIENRKFVCTPTEKLRASHHTITPPAGAESRRDSSHLARCYYPRHVLFFVRSKGVFVPRALPLSGSCRASQHRIRRGDSRQAPRFATHSLVITARWSLLYLPRRQVPVCASPWG